MNVDAPELSALIIIFRSTGPVISTTRSVSRAGGGATRHSPARMSAVSASSDGRWPASRACWRWRRASSSRSLVGLKATCSRATNASASRVSTGVVSIDVSPMTCTGAVTRLLRRGHRGAGEVPHGARQGMHLGSVPRVLRVAVQLRRELRQCDPPLRARCLLERSRARFERGDPTGAEPVGPRELVEVGAAPTRRSPARRAVGCPCVLNSLKCTDFAASISFCEIKRARRRARRCRDRGRSPSSTMTPLYQ